MPEPRQLVSTHPTIRHWHLLDAAHNEHSQANQCCCLTLINHPTHSALDRPQHTAGAGGPPNHHTLGTQSAGLNPTHNEHSQANQCCFLTYPRLKFDPHKPPHTPQRTGPQRSHLYSQHNYTTLETAHAATAAKSFQNPKTDNLGAGGNICQQPQMGCQPHCHPPPLLQFQIPTSQLISTTQPQHMPSMHIETTYIHKVQYIIK